MRKSSIMLLVPCMLVLMVGTAWATSPYDMPYGIQWSFIIGNSAADNTRTCTVSPDGSVWMTTMGAGGTTPALTWGNPKSVYGGAYASGYGQISPNGLILQANDFPAIQGMTSYSQGYYPKVAFAGSDPDPYIGITVNSNALWSDSTVDTNSAKGHLMTFKITSLAGSTPVDYDGNTGGNLPIKNTAGIDVSQKWTHDYLSRNEDGGPYCSGMDYVVDTAGNYYVTGGAQWGSIGQPLDPNSDMFTAGDYSGPPGTAYSPYVGRIGNDGTTLSGPAHQPEAPARTYALDIAHSDATGNTYIAGYGSSSNGTMSYFDPDGPGPIAAITLDPNTPDTLKGYAIAYDSSWNILKAVVWESTQGGDYITDIQPTSDGGFIICGRTKGDLHGTNPTPGTTDACVEKYKADGTLDWSYQAQTSFADAFAAMKIDADGNIYISGTQDTGSGSDPFVVKFDSAGNLVWTSVIDNGGTSESNTDVGALQKEKIYVLSQHNPSAGGTPWTNTISYVPVGNNENLLQKLSPGDFNSDGVVDFTDVQLGGNAAAAAYDANPSNTVDTYDFDGDGKSSPADAQYMITKIMDRVLGDIHPGANFDIPGDVDNADLGKAGGSFTGSQPFGTGGMGYFDGDMDFDGDVDNADLGLVSGAFTGSLAGNKTDSPTIADLIYDPTTGNVKMDASEAAGGVITSFQLENDDGTFNPANYVGPPNPYPPEIPAGFGRLFEDVSGSVIGDTDNTYTGFSGIHDFGNIFPLGMDLDQLEAYLTTAVYTGQLGTGQQQLDLVVIPEPATLALLGLGGLGMLSRRRRK